MKAADFAANGPYVVGRVVGAVSARYEACKTEPPRRYTQSDLIDEMMAAYKFARTDQDRAVLHQIKGLGTARTREPTITGLLERGFLQECKSVRSRGRVELVPMPLARTTLEHLPPMLTDVCMTAKWELAFRLIEQGKAEPEDAMRYLRTTLETIVREARAKGRIALPPAPPPAPQHFGGAKKRRSASGRAAHA